MVIYDEDGRRLSSAETAEMSEMMADYSGVRAAYEIKLADAKADLLKDGQDGVDSYV